MIKSTRLTDGLAKERQDRNIEYLLELDKDKLLLPFRIEAGLIYGLHETPPQSFGGWESSYSQIRGTFTGHFLSATARLYNETNNEELYIKNKQIVMEIRNCQLKNKNGWCFSIPEKYVLSLKEDAQFWASQYVCQKILMGLLDTFIYTDNTIAIDIINDATDWFINFINNMTKKEMKRAMNVQETGACMQTWADIYNITSDPRHLRLMKAYERTQLYDNLLNDVETLSNIHANTTIPEIHGCCRAYEVTGEERYRVIAEKYWNQAVTNRGYYATGGQTSGESWVPKGQLYNRLGTTNQEHCTVYNMICLAEYLYKWTGEKKYHDYIELNIYNGIFAQTFYKDPVHDCVCTPRFTDYKVVSYYLPLKTDSEKKWGSKFEHFWCCHCTAVQANARIRDFIFYKDKENVYINQFFNSKLNNEEFEIEITEKNLSGVNLNENGISTIYEENPKFMSYEIKVVKTNLPIQIRIPNWCNNNYEIKGVTNFKSTNEYIKIASDYIGTIELILYKKIEKIYLDDTKYFAYRNGPIVLAGLNTNSSTILSSECTLVEQGNSQYNGWNQEYILTDIHQDIKFKPIFNIGTEHYTTYFTNQK